MPLTDLLVPLVDSAGDASPLVAITVVVAVPLSLSIFALPLRNTSLSDLVVAVILVVDVKTASSSLVGIGSFGF